MNFCHLKVIYFIKREDLSVGPCSFLFFSFSWIRQGWAIEAPKKEKKEENCGPTNYSFLYNFLYIYFLSRKKKRK